MSSKEDLKSKYKTVFYEDAPYSLGTAYESDDVSEMMEKYAKSVAIKFREWQDENTEGYKWENYDGHDTWYNGHTREVIETPELFERFLTQTHGK